MNSAVYKILRLLFAVLFMYPVITLIVSFIPLGTADFQCSVRYDETNKCSKDNEAGVNYQIESFLSTYMVRWDNGGCNYKYTEKSILEFPTSVTNLRLERDGDNLIVNGEILGTGNEFHIVKFLNWSPWVISEMKFENIGLVASCNSASTNKRILIVGNYGTKVSFLKGLFFSSFIYLRLCFYEQKGKDNKAFQISLMYKNKPLKIYSCSTKPQPNTAYTDEVGSQGREENGR